MVILILLMLDVTRVSVRYTNLNPKSGTIFQHPPIQVLFRHNLCKKTKTQSHRDTVGRRINMIRDTSVPTKYDEESQDNLIYLDRGRARRGENENEDYAPRVFH